MRNILAILCLLFFQIAVCAENQWSLKGGAGINYQTLVGEEDSEDEIVGLSINTSFGYRFTDFSLNTASYISAGKANNIYFRVSDTEILADSTFVTINFMFLVKYYTQINVLKNNSLYFSLGPGIGIQSFWPSQYQVIEGSFSDNEKVTYEIFGIFLAVGIEERVLFKEENPKFLELLIGASRSYKANIIYSGDPKDSTIVTSDSTRTNFDHLIFSLNFGITFF